MTTKKKVLAALGALVLAGATAMVVVIGPRNVIGMLRYDQREEGRLRVGDAAPDVDLRALAGPDPQKLSAYIGEKPLVLIFGSFT